MNETSIFNKAPRTEDSQPFPVVISVRRCQRRFPVDALHACAILMVGMIAMLLAQPTYGQSKPNIILINLDDADSEMFELSFADQLYPNIMAVANSGISFTNLHVTTPFCGPSRACLYRGQYAHNTGICVNEPGVKDSHNFNGGFKYYREQGYFDDDLSIWMKNAGYRTMLVGKFLHHDFEPFVPPGWDDFHSYLGARYYGTWRFSNEHSAAGAGDHLAEGIYRTTAEADDAVKLLQAHAARDNQQPFFLNINPIGPHHADPNFPEMVEVHKRSWWTEMIQPYSPAFDEFDMTDKRGHFRGLPPISNVWRLFTHLHYRDRALATRSCDDMVGKIRETLANLGLDENTFIFITSDNGFSNGHHRTFGKGTPIDRCTRVPCFVMGPGVPAGRTADQLIAHIDLAPTFVALAKGTTPDFVDGRSFVHLLSPNGIDNFPAFKQALLVENWSTLTEFDTRSFGASTTLRMADSVYTEWANGDKDFFDLKSDPQQINNTFDELAPWHQDFFAWWLRLLKNPNQQSKARFSNPYLRDQTIAKGTSLRGLAEDSLGIKRVFLAISDVSTNRYWNGTAWQDSFTQVNTELENPNGQITFWNYSAMPSGADAVSGQVAAWAWAFDEDFHLTPPTLALFKFDESPPELHLNSPTSGQRFSGPAFFQGTATDNLEVKEIRITIRDQNTNYYWNNGEFQIAEAHLVTQPDKYHDWGLMLSLPTGAYNLTVDAVDESGNASPAEPDRSFFVELTQFKLPQNVLNCGNWIRQAEFGLGFSDTIRKDSSELLADNRYTFLSSTLQLFNRLQYQ
jgi:arylsulfatase A-like enzyme